MGKDIQDKLLKDIKGDSINERVLNLNELYFAEQGLLTDLKPRDFEGGDESREPDQWSPNPSRADTKLDNR